MSILKKLLPLSCRGMLERMTDEMEGGLTGWDRIRARLHLRLCPHCRCYREQLEVTRRALGELPADEPEPELAERLLAEHERKQRDS